MQRYLYRAQCEAWNNPELHSLMRSRKMHIQEKMARGKVSTLSLFAHQHDYFLYYECEGEPVEPAGLLLEEPGLFAAWPGASKLRLWVPMMDIFHYQAPVSAEHWKRKQPGAEAYGRIALLRPEWVASYIYYHYQYQEEQPGAGHKYGIIGLHENLLFFYSERPAVLEAAPYSGKLQSRQTPENWVELMEPHFIKWEHRPPDQTIWLNLTLVLQAEPAYQKGDVDIHA
ncbi:hypothetical protein GCM10010912_58840 [Paenibacillus albidus]|uniref:Uncharacterized protein n=1 Tax=Paenibacillus albidus TaxID=2041023 RepID=A0A917FTA1_9BACL|nr:hypothetical protein [Paenibacillus albidus]GGG06464.1 hypothetical protein GCM10010912_58840 [Paenibacillus albidus]